MSQDNDNQAARGPAGAAGGRQNMSSSQRAANAVAAGVLMSLGFVWEPGRLLAWVGLLPLLRALAGATPRQAFKFGYIAGLVYFVVVLHWIVSLTYWAGAVAIVGGVAVICYLALYFAAFAAAYRWVERDLPLLATLTGAPVWVMLEFIQSRLFTGFGWGLIGYPQWRSNAVLQWASIGGVYMVSMWIVAVNCFIHAATVRERAVAWKTRTAWGLATIVLVAGVVAGGMWLRDAADALEVHGYTQIGVVQGSFSQEEKWNPDYFDYMVAVQTRLTQECIDKGAQLVVWPETSLPGERQPDDTLDQQLLDVLSRSGTQLIVGTVVRDGDRYYNSALGFDPRAVGVRAGGRYDKMHLVPFGEYVPLRSWFPFLARLVPAMTDFQAGDAPGIIKPRERSFGVLICFEVLFPHMARTMASSANFLLSMSNLAWFGNTVVPEHVLGQAVFRAVENRIGVVCANNTGISCLIDPSGYIIQRVGEEGKELFVRGTAVAAMPRRVQRSDYTHWGDLLCYLSFLALPFCWWVRKAALRRWRILTMER